LEKEKKKRFEEAVKLNIDLFENFFGMIFSHFPNDISWLGVFKAKRAQNSS